MSRFTLRLVYFSSAGTYCARYGEASRVINYRREGYVSEQAAAYEWSSSGGMLIRRGGVDLLT